MCLVSQVSDCPDLGFDIDIPLWNEVDRSSTCTGTATHAESVLYISCQHDMSGQD